MIGEIVEIDHHVGFEDAYTFRSEPLKDIRVKDDDIEGLLLNIRESTTYKYDMAKRDNDKGVGYWQQYLNDLAAKLLLEWGPNRYSEIGIVRIANKFVNELKKQEIE
jgi:hypothetical protein